MNTARQVSFGSDLRLVNQVVKTGREIGGTFNSFWALLAHDQELFQGFVQTVLEQNYPATATLPPMARREEPSRGLMEEVLTTGSKVGADVTFWQLLVDEPQRWSQGVAYVERGGYQAPLLASSSPKQFGPDEVEYAFGVQYTSEQLQELDRNGFRSQVVMSHLDRDDYVLFPGYPLSLQELHRRFHRLIIGDDGGYMTWMQGHDYTQETELRWYLVSTTLEEPWGYYDYTGKHSPIPSGYSLLYPVEVVYLTLLLYLVTGRRILATGDTWTKRRSSSAPLRVNYRFGINCYKTFKAEPQRGHGRLLSVTP